MECIELKQPEELNARQKKVILHLLTAKTVKEVASAARVRLPTVYQWMKNPLFVAELERMREEVISDVVSRLKVNCLQAVTVFQELMTSPKSSGALKRSCASDILDHTKSFIQLRDLEARLEHLEAAIMDNTNKERGVKSYVYQRNG